MKRKLLNLIVLILFAGLAAGFIPKAADAQDGINQRPQLLVKIHNIDQFMNDVEKLMRPFQGSQAIPPTAMVRGMLQGTSWIDSQRSIVAGMISRNGQSKWVVLIPFRAPNPNFQGAIGAVVGADYYLAAFPPEPGFSVNPAFKESLLKASAAATTGSLGIEVAVGPFLDATESQLAAAMKKMETSPQAQMGQSGMSPKESMEMFSGMLKTLRQAETLRYGLDLSGDILTLQIDIDAIPNTPLAGALVDSGEDTRLMNYNSDMPIQFRSRAHDMASLLNLMGSAFGSFYRRMGLDFEKMGDMTKSFTGETAGGMRLSSNGLALETISILQPGVNGEAFLSNTYLPWLTNYSLQMSNLTAQQTGKPPVPIYERTADSMVAGVKVMGVKPALSALVPSEKRKDGILDNMAFEIRIAAVGDLMFMASDDAKLEGLINRARALKKSPAQGPISRIDLELGTFFKEIQALSPSAGASVVWPDNLGKLTTYVEMHNGKLITRTSFNIDDLRKLSASFKAQTKK